MLRRHAIVDKARMHKRKRDITKGPDVRYVVRISQEKRGADQASTLIAAPGEVQDVPGEAQDKSARTYPYGLT